MKIAKYSFQIFRYLLIPYVVGFILFRIFPEYRFSLYPYMILFFMAMGVPFFFTLKKLTDSNQRRFVNSFLIATFIKLMLSVFCVILYVWFDKERAMPFVITFFVFYIILSVCEIRILNTKRSDKGKS